MARSGASDPKAGRLDRGVTQGIGDLFKQPSDREALDPWDPRNRRNAVLLTPQQVAPLLRRRGHLLKHLEWPFLDPNSTARRCWDAAYHFCMAFQLVYLPFQIAFLSAADLEDPLLSSGSVVLAVVDFFFLADMLLNFTTGFYSSMQVLQTDSRVIVRHYAAGWFPVDFVATVPAIFYRVVLYSGGPELRYLNATMPLRLLRLGKIQEDVRRLEAHLKSPLFTSAMWLAKLFLLPILISHCSACLLWLVGRRNLERDPSVNSWIKDGLPEVGDGVLLGEISVFERYVCAMYFSVTVMSTVGLGDIAARLASERVLLMLIMIITSIVVGVVVNGVAQFFAKLGERSAETNERLTSASKFMKWYGVPTDLQARVHVYLKQFFDNKDREDMKGQLIDWIKKSKLLRAELNLALTGNCLAGHRLLAELPRDLLVEVCELCDMVFHPPGEVLESPGSDVQRCLYIRAGCVQLSERASSLPQAAQLALPLPRDSREQRDADSADVSAGGESSRSSSPGEEECDLAGEWQEDLLQADLRRTGGALGSGSFLSDAALFLGSMQAARHATCTSFCELISLDVDVFRQRMGEQDPYLLHALGVYTAIELDCPRILLRHLQDFHRHPDELLLHGERPLHECAKMNAAKCAKMLIGAGATVDALDAEGATPAEHAAGAKHRAVLEILVMSGALLGDDLVLPASSRNIQLEPSTEGAGEDALRPATSQQAGLSLVPSVQGSSFFTVDRAHKEDLRSFRLYVESYGLSLDDTGQAGLKGLEDLYLEIKSGQCTLEGTGHRRRLRRRVVLARLRLVAVIDNEVRALVEMEPEHWLRCPGAQVAKLPSKRVSFGLISSALEELAVGRLGLSPEFFERHVANLSTSTYTEVKASATYPGLETEYMIVESTMRVRKLGALEGDSIGLPRGRAFQREEELEHHVTTRRVFFWATITSLRADNPSLEGHDCSSQGSGSTFAHRAHSKGRQALAPPPSGILRVPRFSFLTRRSVLSNASGVSGVSGGSGGGIASLPAAPAPLAVAPLPPLQRRLTTLLRRQEAAPSAGLKASASSGPAAGPADAAWG